VTSGGDKVIKQARKDLVKRVELELAKLDQLKEHEWERQSERARSEAGEGSVHAQDDDAAAAGASSLSSLLLLLLRSRADVLPLAAPSSSADPAAAEPEPAVAEPAAPASPSSSPAPGSSTSAPADTPLDELTRLTAESLAALPTAAADPTSTVPRPRSRTSTTSHASDTSSAVDRYVGEVLQRAKALAERVDAEEEAERAASAPAPAGGAAHAAEASATPSAAAEVADSAAAAEPAAVEAPSIAPGMNEPLETGGEVKPEPVHESLTAVADGEASLDAQKQEPLLPEAAKEQSMDDGTARTLCAEDL